jgi:hypothetical protein
VLVIKLTFWEAVDEFLRDLAKGDVCGKPRYPDNEYYRRLMSTVCEGGEDALGIIRVKPYYPFILIAYYILFHRHNLDLAGKIHSKLREFHDKYPYTFTSDEECAFEMLGEVIHGLASGQSPREIARRLGEDYDGERCPDWSVLFKLLLQSHLDPVNHEKYEAEFHRVEESLPSLRDIYREIEEAEREDDVKYPGEVNYYIMLPLSGVEESPIYVFIRSMFGKYHSNLHVK